MLSCSESCAFFAESNSSRRSARIGCNRCSHSWSCTAISRNRGNISHSFSGPNLTNPKPVRICVSCFIISAARFPPSARSW